MEDMRKGQTTDAGASVLEFGRHRRQTERPPCADCRPQSRAEPCPPCLELQPRAEGTERSWKHICQKIGLLNILLNISANSHEKRVKTWCKENCKKVQENKKKALNPFGIQSFSPRAADQIRTGDLILTKDEGLRPSEKRSTYCISFFKTLIC